MGESNYKSPLSLKLEATRTAFASSSSSTLHKQALRPTSANRPSPSQSLSPSLPYGSSTSASPSPTVTKMRPNASLLASNALRPSSSRQSPGSTSRGGGGANMLSKPRGYNCFLCGAQFGSASLLIHVSACKKKWGMVEEAKPLRERRRVPPDPLELLDPLPLDPGGIDNFNARMLDIWGTASLIVCSICTRSFRPDAFERHSKMCTRQTPGGPHGLPLNVKAPPHPSAPQAQSFSSAPKTYSCYLCGRGFGTSSISIHLPQCLEKWYKSEGVKAPRERREPPPPPPELDSPLPSDPAGIQEFNSKMEDIFNSRSLLQCPYCQRTMNEKALSHHSKACTAEHPMTPASGASRQQAPRPPSALINPKASNESSAATPRPLSHRPPAEPPTPFTPKTYSCYLCGRGFGTSSISIHLPQCLEKWYKSEGVKAPHERREPPPPPPELDSPLPSDPAGIQEFNSKMEDIFNSRSLLQCPYCQRTMNEKALSHHSKACTAEHPMTPALGASRQQTSRPPSASQPSASAPRRMSHLERYEPPAAPLLNPSKLVPSQPSQRESAPTEDDAQRLECQGCGRRFLEAALVTHSRICAKVFGGKKRRVFDSSKHRRAGTDMEQYGAPKGVKKQAPPQAESRRPSAPSAATPKWKQQSEELRAAMRAMKDVKEAQAQGRPLPPPPPSAPDPSLVQCPHCGRRFNEVVATRHIPHCKTTVAKPKFLKAGTGGAGLLVAPQAKTLPKY